MDVMTLGMPEVIWVLPESMGKSPKPYMDAQRTSARVVISYDDRDLILGIFDEFEELPPDGRSGPRQWQR
jgi:hypothetical protein